LTLSKFIHYTGDDKVQPGGFLRENSAFWAVFPVKQPESPAQGAKPTVIPSIGQKFPSVRRETAAMKSGRACPARGFGFRPDVVKGGFYEEPL
jgi:hypothetical protein